VWGLLSGRRGKKVVRLTPLNPEEELRRSKRGTEAIEIPEGPGGGGETDTTTGEGSQRAHGIGGQDDSSKGNVHKGAK